VLSRISFTAGSRGRSESPRLPRRRRSGSRPCYLAAHPRRLRVEACDQDLAPCFCSNGTTPGRYRCGTGQRHELLHENEICSHSSPTHRVGNRLRVLADEERASWTGCCFSGKQQPALTGHVVAQRDQAECEGVDQCDALTTRLRPARLASYMASSAASRRAWASDRSSLNTAQPMDAVTASGPAVSGTRCRRSLAATGRVGLRRRQASRVRTQNSSPPSDDEIAVAYGAS